MIVIGGMHVEGPCGGDKVVSLADFVEHDLCVCQMCWKSNEIEKLVMESEVDEVEV